MSPCKLYYIMPRSFYKAAKLFSFLPLKPLDYQLIYAAHHLYPSFLLYTEIRRSRAPAKYKSRTCEKITLGLGNQAGAAQVTANGRW